MSCDCYKRDTPCVIGVAARYISIKTIKAAVCVYFFSPSLGFCGCEKIEKPLK